MKQMARGAMAVLALIGISACVTDPQERINNDDFHTLQSYPEVMWLKAGVVGGTSDSTSVYFRLINDFGYGTPTHLTLKGVTGTIRVRQDTTFREYYTDGNPNDTTPVIYLDGSLQRWFVFTNFQPGEGTFTIAASNGVETTVHVRVEASNLGTLPTETAVPGQLITLTAPPFETFTPDAVVTYLRGARPTGYPCTVTLGVPGAGCLVGQTTSDTARAGTSTSAGPATVSADGKTLTFRAAIDMVGVIRVSKTVPTFTGLDPAAFAANAIQLQTLDTLHVAGLGTPKAYDYTTGASTDTIATTGGSTTIGGTAVTSANPGDVLKVTFGGFPGSLGTTAGTVPIGFLANTRIFIGGVEAGVVFTATQPPVAAIGADSNSVSILVPAHLSPPAGKPTLPITLTSAAFTFDPTFLFGVAAVSSTAVQTGSPAILRVGTLTGTGNTAPPTNYAAASTRAAAIQLPDLPFFPTSAANARAFIINDATPFTPLGTGDCVATNFPTPPTGKTITGCKFYKLSFQTTRTVESEIRWDNTLSADMGVIAMSAATPATTTALKAATGTAGTGGQPANTGTTTTAVNGQYLAIVQYSTTATVIPWTSLRLTVR